MLTVTDGNTTKSVTKYIRVFDKPRELPILDGFELYDELGNTLEWEIYNQESNSTFEIVEGVAATGNKSLKLNNYNSEASNVDELHSAIYDLSNITSTSGITISFKYSYRKRVSNNTEKLQVLYSSDCGDTWDIRKTIQGNALSSEVIEEPWTPTEESDWKQIHLTNITSNYWNSDFRFKFRFEGSGGNNIYIDDINIYAASPSTDPVGEEEEPSLGLLKIKKNPIGFSIFPNPAKEDFKLSYESNEHQKVELKLMDLLGKSHINKQFVSTNGQNTELISIAHLAKGVYIVKLTFNDKEYTKELVIK